MPLYARRDVMSVAVPPESGGCGDLHSRPVEGGAPVKVWALHCPMCERVLWHSEQDHDPLWSREISRIPETPTEQSIREDREKQGEQARNERQEEAFTVIAEAMRQDAAFKDRLMDLMARMAAPSSPPSAEAAPQTAMGEALTKAMTAADEMPACPECGGPLRKPGARGPLPKKCADCRKRTQGAQN